MGRVGDWASHPALVPALSQMSTVSVILGVTFWPHGLHHAAEAGRGTNSPSWSHPGQTLNHLVPQLVLQCLLEEWSHGRDYGVRESVWKILKTEENAHSNPERMHGMRTPLPTGAAMPMLGSLSSHPLVPSAATKPWDLVSFFIIYGARVSSRKWGEEPEIIHFVLSLSFKGNRNVLGKGQGVHPHLGAMNFRPTSQGEM